MPRDTTLTTTREKNQKGVCLEKLKVPWVITGWRLIFWRELNVRSRKGANDSQIDDVIERAARTPDTL